MAPHRFYCVIDHVSGMVAARPWSAFVALASNWIVITYVAEAPAARGDIGTVTKVVLASPASVDALDRAGHGPAWVGYTQASVAPLVVLATVTSTLPQKPDVSEPT